MDILVLVATLLRSLSVISRDPALGPRGGALGGVLGLAAVALERGSAGAAQLRDLVTEVERMASENRDPTPQEWETLKSRSDAAHAILNPPERA